MAKRIIVKKKVTYYPPPPEDIAAYTRTVCEALSKTIDGTFDTPEMRNELAGFLKVIASIYAKQLNKSAEALDKKNPKE